MALDNAKNFAKVVVSTGYTSSDTSIVLQAGNGAKLPTVPFNLVWWNSSDYPDPSDDPNVEIVRCTNISTDTLTVTRAQESTTATNKNTAGRVYKMIAGLTAKTINTDIPGLITVPYIVTMPSTGNSRGFTANRLSLQGILIEDYCTITTIGYNSNTADNTSNLYDFGLYDINGNLVVNLGAQAGSVLFPGTGTRSATIAQNSVLITPGRYYQAYACVTATASIGGAANIPTFAAAATIVIANAVMPPSITPPADSWSVNATVACFVLR